MSEVKDFTPDQAKNYIYNSYSECSIEFLCELFRYWSGKHPTQVLFRKFLFELISSRENGLSFFKDKMKDMDNAKALLKITLAV